MRGRGIIITLAAKLLVLREDVRCLLILIAVARTRELLPRLQPFLTISSLAFLEISHLANALDVWYLVNLESKVIFGVKSLKIFKFEV